MSRDRKAKLRTYDIRYEDLRSQLVPVLAGLMTFLLPPEDLPSLDRLACAIRSRPTAYKFRRASIFDAWDRYEDETRDWILGQVKDVWCKFGYDQLLQQETASRSPIDCKASQQRL